MTATSYAERARRFRAERARAEDPGREESDKSEERGADGNGGVWWDDPILAPPSDDGWLREVRASYAPILHLPPRGCLGPSVCSRVGPCDRHAAGRPCDVGGGRA